MQKSPAGGDVSLGESGARCACSDARFSLSRKG